MYIIIIITDAITALPFKRFPMALSDLSQLCFSRSKMYARSRGSVTTTIMVTRYEAHHSAMVSNLQVQGCGNRVIYDYQR